ncbi:MAG: hypothetical protein Q9226_008192 [Calogaya cf. arnoldii]
MGPILGGVIGATIGWRWIFWFLSIVSGLCLLLIILTLPETARNIVGNGSIVPSPLYRLPITDIMGNSQVRTDGPNSEVARRILDRNYRITAKSHNLPVDKVRGDNLLTFPVKKARLRSASLPTVIAAVTFMGYGWSLHCHAPLQHLSIPLVLQFLLGLSVQMCFNINNTLLIDINHRTPATAQAASNIIRCALAAIAVAVLEDVIGGVGIGWTFTLLGFGALGSGVLYWMDRRWGIGWRTASHEGHETEEVMDIADEEEKSRRTAEQEGCDVNGSMNAGAMK